MLRLDHASQQRVRHLCGDQQLACWSQKGPSCLATPCTGGLVLLFFSSPLNLTIKNLFKTDCSLTTVP